MNTRSNQYEHLEIPIKPKKSKKIEKKRVKKWKKSIVVVGNYKMPKWIPSEYYEENEELTPRGNDKKEVILSPSDNQQSIKSPDSNPKSPPLSSIIGEDRPEDDFDSLLSPR